MTTRRAFAAAWVAVLLTLSACSRSPSPGAVSAPAVEPAAQTPWEPALIEHFTSASSLVGRTVNRFDRAGRLVRSELDADGDGKVDQLIIRSYDSGGRLVEVNEGERRVRSEFDAAGRLAARSTEGPGGRVLRTVLTYDDRGRLVSETDALNLVRYQYDDAGRRLCEQRFAPGEATPRAEQRFRYDERGRRAASEGFDETGRRRETWRYDRNDRVTTSTLARDGSLQLETRIAYDASGRRIAEEYLDAHQAPQGRRSLAYDDRGNLINDETVDLISHQWTRDRFSYDPGAPNR